MENKKITKDLAESLYKIQVLSKKDKDHLHLLVTDFFGAMFAGYRQNAPFNRAIENVVLSREGAEEACVFRQKRKFPATAAAFMNSAYGHGAELDDGNKKAMGHAGVHVIPAVFALADKLGSSGEDVLIALATGYEAYIRISAAAQPGLVKRGFHSTGMAGTLGCTAACARLFGLDAQGIEDAVALSTTLSGGLLSYGDSRPAIKPLNPGKAAENGVFAAMLTNEGVKGPEEALEGPNGWFHAVTDKVHEEMLLEGDHLLLHDCYFKLYPSCRHTHCTIEAAVNLSSQVRPEEIKKVDIYIYPNAIKLAGQIRYPKDGDDTKFSIHYTTACALKNGTYGIADMDNFHIGEEMVALIEKIEIIPDESMENRKAAIRGARVEIEKNNGEILTETVLVPKGDPEKPLTREDIIAKLRTCAAGQADDALIDRLVAVIEDIKGEKIFVNPMSLI
ncbi:MAG: MmgE/PrpD family protein [Lachnospiraceae bacterium]|jgi:2-methylcitrate dehydratase PrpD